MNRSHPGHPSNGPDLSRRAIIKGAIGVTGASTLGTAVPFGAFGESAAIPVRQDIAAFAQNSSRLASFEAAVKEMKDRSRVNPDDPKGWLATAKAHADFCAVPGIADAGQIHFCWWFLPWHRAYITVTERKIREISGDKSFAYPYWNWSSDRRIPNAFARAGSSLADAVRFTPNRAIADGEVGFFPDDPGLKQLGVAALGAAFFQAKTAPQIERSFGGIARPNATSTFGNNQLEATPHGPIHVYVGGVSADGQAGGDMIDFETAARDPIFFSHHGNLDRLWETWRRDTAHKSTEPAIDAFVKHPFPFTWLDGTTIQVTVEETLDTRKLGYTYDSLEVFRPGPQIVSAQSVENRLAPIASEKVRVPLSPQGADDNQRKILEITGVEKPEHPMTVGVYVKPVNAPAGDPGVNVGTFAAVRAGGVIAWPSQTLSFDITDTAKRFAGQELTIELIPYRIRAQGAESYPALKYGQMRVVTER
jgi:hypothetical protein